MTGLPSFYSEKIHSDEPKTLEKSIRKAKYFYEKNKGRPTFQKALDDKKKSKMEQRKNGHKPPFFINSS
jgi:hypothetical protein